MYTAEIHSLRLDQPPLILPSIRLCTQAHGSFSLRSHHLLPIFPPSPAFSLPPLFLQCLALFDWTLSQDSPGRIPG